MAGKDYDKTRDQILKLCKEIQGIEMGEFMETHARKMRENPRGSKNNEMMESCFFAIHRAQQIIPKVLPKVEKEKPEAPAKPTKPTSK